MTTISFKSSSTEQARKKYAEFEEKVKRTVFLNNLSPTVTSAVISNALNQFGDVVSVEFLPNYTIPSPIPQCALVEMKNPKQAAAAITEMTNYPFMMSGMPRPIRAQAANAEMFSDRPPPPGREIEVRWVKPSDPVFEIGKRMKQLCKKHTVETLQLTKLTLAEEEKLAKQQAVTLETAHKKYDLTQKIKKDSDVLASYYQMYLADDD